MGVEAGRMEQEWEEDFLEPFLNFYNLNAINVLPIQSRI